MNRRLPLAVADSRCAIETLQAAGFGGPGMDHLLLPLVFLSENTKKCSI